MIYADCVTLTRYGGQNVNLLEVITMEAAGGRDFHQTAYKPLNKSLVDAISIEVTSKWKTHTLWKMNDHDSLTSQPSKINIPT